MDADVVEPVSFQLRHGSFDVFHRYCTHLFGHTLPEVETKDEHRIPSLAQVFRVREAVPLVHTGAMHPDDDLVLMSRTFKPIGLEAILLDAVKAFHGLGSLHSPTLPCISY